MSSSGRSTATWSSLESLPATATFISLKWVCSSPALLPSHLVHWYGCSPCFVLLGSFDKLWAGIKPMWEDEANKFGGKWIVRLRKGGEFQIFWCFFSYSWVLWISGLSSRCWENLVLAMLGEQFMVGEEICGAVVSIRFQEDILRSAKSNRHICWANQVLVAVMMMTINTESLSPYHMNWTIVCSIWNRTACDQAVTNRIRDTFRRVWILHFLHLLADVELIDVVHLNSQTTHFHVLISHFFFSGVESPNRHCHRI